MYLTHATGVVYVYMYNTILLTWDSRTLGFTRSKASFGVLDFRDTSRSLDLVQHAAATAAFCDCPCAVVLDEQCSAAHADMGITMWHMNSNAFGNEPWVSPAMYRNKTLWNLVRRNRNLATWPIMKLNHCITCLQSYEFQFVNLSGSAEMPSSHLTNSRP